MNLLEAERAIEITKRMLKLFDDALAKRLQHAHDQHMAHPVSEDDQQRHFGWLEGFKLARDLGLSIEIQDLDANEVAKALLLTEDAQDIHESEKALAEPERTSVDDLRKELDIDR